jgi:hypothetical protein
MTLKHRWTRIALAIAVALTAVPAVAQQSTPPPAVDPGAVAALNHMAGYLRTLKTFQVEAATTRDSVSDDGQLITRGTTVNYVVQMPNKVLADVVSDRSERQFVYDGKTFTMLARRVGFYATIPAPPTVRELDDLLGEKYDIELPLADLFRWGTPSWIPAGITRATDLGPAEMLGTTCEQYGFRQDGVDWQIWIQLGDSPLPRKLNITTTTDEARPRYSAIFTWNLAPSVNDGAFVFTPPKGAVKIPLAEVGK